MRAPISPRDTKILAPPKERFPMSHAPYLATQGEGAVALVWFAGSREWAKDVHLHLATYAIASRQWSPVRDFVADVGFSLGNSVLERAPAGTFHLWYVRTKGYWQDGEIVHMPFSDLNGGFSAKTVLPLETGWLVRGRPILRGNHVFLPVYHETRLVSAVWEQELNSGDGRLSETMGGDGGLIHPTLVPMGENEFRCFMRNPRAPNRVHFAYSMDRGATWSRPFPTVLPNPNSGIDVARLPDGRLVCAYNDSEKKRYPLSLAVSQNAGVDWKKVGDIERLPGEFSYPSLLFAGDTLFLAYTYKREGIRFLALEPEMLRP